MKNFKQLTLLTLTFFGLAASAQDWTSCDDFTDTVNFPTTTHGSGELIGYTQGGTQEIRTVSTEYCNVNDYVYTQGIYAGGTINFDFDGSSQTAQFNVYTLAGEEYYMYTELGVNGYDMHSFSESYPMTLGGVTVNVEETTGPDVYFDYFVVTFSGYLDSVQFYLLESGLTELCVAPFTDTVDSGCDNFTDLVYFPTHTYTSGEIIGYTQGGTETIIAVDGSYVNDYFPGIYGVSNVEFEFNGSNQIARFLSYGNLGQFNEMGFSVNGSPVVMLDETFPMTVAGVEVDLDLSPTNIDSWEYFYLTFTGNIDVVSHLFFESGVTELCVEPLEEEGAGIADEATNSLNLYPNPVDALLTITSNEPLGSIKIYNLSGEIVLDHSPTNGTSEQIDLSSLEAGFYVVVSTNLNGQNTVSKVTKN